MLKVIEILKRHNEQLKEEIRDAIVEHEVVEKKINFEDVPSFSISQEIEFEIGEKEYRYTLSVALLSAEDQRIEQVKKVLKEIEENPVTKFH